MAETKKTPTKKSARNIYQKLSWVSEKVGYIKKNEKIEIGSGGYWAVNHDAVTATVQPLFVEAGILVLPSILSSKYETDMLNWEKEGYQGKMQLRREFLYTASFTVRFQNIDDKEDYCLVIVDGFAMDSQDKHPGIALSYAVKSAILKVLSLETGESDESRINPPKQEAPELITAKQVIDLASLADNPTTIEKLCTYFAVKELKELPADKFARAKTKIEATLKVKNDKENK